MYFENIAALIAMDGHGAFVWSAYAITAAVMVSLVVSPLQRKRRLLSDIRTQSRRETANNQR
jgi:heme exporter protein D